MSGQRCTVNRKNLKIEDLLFRIIQERDNMVNVGPQIEEFKSDQSFAIPDMNIDDPDPGRCATGAVRPPCPRQHTIQPAHVTQLYIRWQGLPSAYGEWIAEAVLLQLPSVVAHIHTYLRNSCIADPVPVSPS